MLSNDFVATLFRIINFIFVISLFVYIFKRYILKDLKFNINKAKNYFLSLTNKSKELDDRSKELDFEVSYQEHLSKDLLSKIRKWRDAHQKQLDEQAAENEIIEKRISEKLKMQEQILTSNNIKNEILKSAIDKSRIELIKEFELKNNALRYQQEIVNFLNKK